MAKHYATLTGNELVIKVDHGGGNVERIAVTGRRSIRALLQRINDATADL